MTFIEALFWTGVALLTAIVICFIVSAVRDVKVSRHTGLDPRLDRTAGLEAADKIAARKRHPSTGEASEEA